jgi:hypothetical protein
MSANTRSVEEFRVRAAVVGGGERRMASGVVRHHVNLRVIGVTLLDDEVFPPMPQGRYADQHAGKVPAGQMSLPEGDEEGDDE